jgi:hypothetical protein
MVPDPPLQPGDPDYNPIMDSLHGFHLYYDRQVRPITLRQWAQLHDDESYVRLAEDYLDDGHIWVSTVWLGNNHNFGSGPPLIFETMLFVKLTDEQVADRRRRWQELGFGGRDFPWEDLECERYYTVNEALEGHQRIVESLTLKIEIFEERA